MTKINICGVPEHFNLPWQLCLNNGDFDKETLDVNWSNIPEGTGKMCQMLRDGETDVAVILTEGIIKDIAFGNPSKIVQMYVESPLVWGIHVDANSNFYNIANLEYQKIAISRLGSGSHLMAIVHANNLNWNVDALKFEIINTIDGAVKALSEKNADYFMWEKLMTKPLVDNGVFRRIGECPTPWPSFVIAVSNSFLEKNAAAIKTMLAVINKKTKSFKSIEGIENTISSAFSLNINDVKLWLKDTAWSQKQLSAEMLNKVQNQLFTIKLIDKKVTFAHAIATL